MNAQSLPIMESFHTIQGEGFHQGRAAWFVRLGGCDVGCVWCDVKESWTAEEHEQQSVSQIVDAAKKSGAEICVITGGEPLMYDLSYLTCELQNAGLKTHLETSGAYPLTGNWDWICFSPKKFKEPVEEICKVSNELKAIVFNQSDFDWAELFAAKVNEDCKLFLQPEWSKEKQMIASIVEYVKQNPNWQISLQVHKYMNVP